MLIWNDKIPFWLKDGQRLEMELDDQIGWKSLEPNTARNILCTHVGKGLVFYIHVNVFTYRCLRTTDLFIMQIKQQ